jgi:hypothetical protein
VAEKPAWTRSEKKHLLEQRVMLIFLVGLLQREECNDADEAAATFAAAADHLPLLNRPTEAIVADYTARLASRMEGKRPRAVPISTESFYALKALAQVAVCKEKMGQTADALVAWDRSYSAAMVCGRGGDVRAAMSMARLVQQLSPDAPPPPLQWLIALSPGAPTATLKMDAPETLARACQLSHSLDSPHHKFAFVPPPGMEFATVRFACDLEQIKLRYGGPFACSARVGGEFVTLGSIRWRKAKPGREVISREFRVPAGSEAIFVTGGPWKGKFVLHEVKVAVTFRPRAKRGGKGKAAASARPQAWIQQELLPRGGKATRNGKPIPAQDIASTLAPGRYVYTYEKPGCKRRFRAELDLRAGRRHGLFVNLDSPFAAALTNLEGLGSMPSAFAGLAKLPDGRWLAAWCGDHKIMLATSKYLVTWSKPWPLPWSSVFRNSDPSLLVDGDGTIHLAYFSKRLDLACESSAGYRLWLTRSADGKKWSLPRPVGGLGQVQYQYPPAQMVRGADGRVWMFWGRFAASAGGPDEIRRLDPLSIALPEKTRMTETQVCVEPGGRMHLTFVSGRSIHYSTSAHGKQWRPPVVLTDMEQYAAGSHPQLLCRGERIALFYETNKGAWLCTGRLAKVPELGPPLKITGHVRPLDGARVHVTADGEVLFLTGDSRPWLMRASLKDVLAQTP